MKTKYKPINKKGELDIFDITLIIWLSLVIITGIIICFIVTNNTYEMNKLCENNNMKHIQNDRKDFCISKDKAYQIMIIDDKPRIIKEVVSLDNTK